MIKKNASMQFLWWMEKLDIMDSWAWTWSSEFKSRKYEFEFVYLIVVIFGMKNKFKVVGDLIKSIYGDLDGNLNVA